MSWGEPMLVNLIGGSLSLNGSKVLAKSISVLTPKYFQTEDLPMKVLRFVLPSIFWFSSFAGAGGTCTDVKLLFMSPNSTHSFTLILERDEAYDSSLFERVSSPVRDTVVVTFNEKKLQEWYGTSLFSKKSRIPKDFTKENFDKCEAYFKEKLKIGKKFCLGYIGSQMRPNDISIYVAYAAEYVKDNSGEYRCYLIPGKI